MHYELAILGGGPAGIAAGVYAARKRIKTVLVAEAVGGQSIDSLGIENWIGTEKISGLELAQAMEKHVRAYAEDTLDVVLGQRVKTLKKNGASFSIQTNEGDYEARAVLVATGGSRRKLEVPGAQEFENKGLTYCASCDGPLFSGQDVAVIGGGNAGFETAAQLLAYAKSVTLIHRSSAFDKADKKTVEAVLADPKMHVLTDTMPTAIKGGAFVEGVEVQDGKTGAASTVPVAGVFVEIGMIPSTDFADGLLETDQFGRIKVNPKDQRSSIEGIWSAGDCTDELYHQNNIAAGDGVKALEDIYFWLKQQEAA